MIILFPYFHSNVLDSLSIFHRPQLFCSQHKAQENGVYIVYQLETNKTIETTTVCRQIIHFFNLFNVKFKTFSNKTNEIMPYVKTRN